MRRLRAIIAPLVGAALLGLAAACTWQGLRPDDATPDRLYIAGELAHVSDRRIIEVASGYLDTGFFELDIEGLRHELAAMPWVAAVSVHRRWPDGVVIRLRERRAVALWRDDAVLAADGALFRPGADERPQGLPRLSGPDGSRDQLREHLPAMRNVLAPIDADIARLTLDQRGSWTVTLADGLELRLGRGDMVRRLERFARYGPAQLGEALQTAGYVDLRYADGFAVGGKRPDPDKEAKDEQAA